MSLSVEEMKKRQEEIDAKNAVEAARLAKERYAAGWPTIGLVVIVKGFLVQATASEEDPAIVNSATERETLLPVLNQVFKNGVLQTPPVPALPPTGALCFVNATMFPEGGQPRFVKNVPFFKTREEALIYLPKDPVRSTNPSANLVAFWPDRYDAPKPLPQNPPQNPPQMKESKDATPPR